MQAHFLGSTGVRVSRLGLGGHTFLQRYGGMDRADRTELARIVEVAVVEGVNLFDVTYDEERSMLGSLVRELGVREKIFIACWLSNDRTGTAAQVKEEANRALTLLGLYSVDLMYLDWTATEEQLAAMTEIRAAGRTRFVGVLGTETALAANLRQVDIVLVNHNYYLREKEPSIELLREKNRHLGIISLEPLGRGRFALGKGGEGVDLVAACLKYALGFRAAHTILVAVRTLSQLRRNLELVKGPWELSRKERAALDEGSGYQIPNPF